MALSGFCCIGACGDAKVNRWRKVAHKDHVLGEKQHIEIRGELRTQLPDHDLRFEEVTSAAIVHTCLAKLPREIVDVLAKFDKKFPSR